MNSRSPFDSLPSLPHGVSAFSLSLFRYTSIYLSLSTYLPLSRYLSNIYRYLYLSIRSRYLSIYSSDIYLSRCISRFYLYLFTYPSIYISAFVCVCVCVSACECAVCVFVCVCVCLCTCVHVSRVQVPGLSGKYLHKEPSVPCGHGTHAAASVLAVLVRLLLLVFLTPDPSATSAHDYSCCACDGAPSSATLSGRCSWWPPSCL